MTDEQLARKILWDMMLDRVGTHNQTPVNVKARENAWQKERAARDLRVADEVFQSPFNRLRKQGS